jgi:hypothetical protein
MSVCVREVPELRTLIKFTERSVNKFGLVCRLYTHTKLPPYIWTAAVKKYLESTVCLGRGRRRVAFRGGIGKKWYRQRWD